MKQLSSLVLFFVLAVPSWCAEPDTPVVQLPTLPVPPVPPSPGPVTKLSAGQLYVITCDSPLLVIGSRDGLISVAKPKTPCTLYGVFVDAKPGDDEGRTYAKGHVYVVRAAGVGQVELIVAPDLSGKGLIRRVLDVDNGQPPGPGPKPPDPPVPDAFQKAVKDAFLQETDTAQRAKQAAWLASVYRNAGPIADSPDVKTLGQLFAKLDEVITNPTSGISRGSLPKVAKVIGSDLNVLCGGTTGGIDPSKPIPDRAALKAAFARYALALEGATR